jgi:hypothetical protein
VTDLHGYLLLIIACSVLLISVCLVVLAVLGYLGLQAVRLLNSRVERIESRLPADG